MEAHIGSLVTVNWLLSKTVIGKTFVAEFRFLLICERKTIIGKTFVAEFRFLLSNASNVSS